MKLIHCADIHLDSPLETNLPHEKARQRRNEICASFVRMTQYAKKNGVCAVLICGDLFDGMRVYDATVSAVLSAIKEAPEIKFFCLRGNHDEDSAAFRTRKLPENLVTFRDDPQSFEIGDIVISGIEPKSGDDFYEKLVLSPEKFNIVMLHGQVSPAPADGCLCLSKLRGRNIDYLALGHIHSYKSESLDGRGAWCYSGCLEGRGFDECGEKGFVLLDIENGVSKREFVPFASRTLHEIRADISGLREFPDILSAALKASGKIDSGDLVKLVLTGECAPDAQKDMPRLLDILSEKFYFAKIKDETSLPVPDDIENEISLRGAFIREVMAADGLLDREKESIIRLGLDALYGRELSL